MKYYQTVSAISGLVLSMSILTSAEASLVHNVGGVDLEWMEFSATVSQSRRDVEAQFVDTNSALYGYRYASSTETQALLESYTGVHNSEGTYTQYAAGMNDFFTDFGTLSSTDFGGPHTQTAGGDGGTYEMSHWVKSFFYYGNADECDNDGWTCWGNVTAWALDGTITAYEVENNWGWDISSGWQNASASSVDFNGVTTASLIVKDASVVPVPAAVWLFSSGLIGLIGVARRRKA